LFPLNSIFGSEAQSSGRSEAGVGESSSCLEVMVEVHHQNILHDVETFPSSPLTAFTLNLSLITLKIAKYKVYEREFYEQKKRQLSMETKFVSIRLQSKPLRTGYNFFM
jgi:hypothetical protein